MRKTGLFLVGFVAVLILFSQTASAQSTEFTYQGRLLFGGVPANGSHDFEFRLFSDADGIGQVGPTVTLMAVNVQNGVFSVRIDFGNQFPGANRFLEIRVRQAGQEFYTVLTPRQAITSAPYAIKSLNAVTADNATALGGIDQTQFVRTSDTRLTDARPPLPNSSDYIRNSTSQQTNSNFHITGNGIIQGGLTVGGEGTFSSLSGSTVNAASGYRIGNQAVLRAFAGNVFAGFDAGLATTSSANSFFGFSAGSSNTTAIRNSFFGYESGKSNTTSNGNSFFGYLSGRNSTGSSNSFFGDEAGFTSTGNGNSFFGKLAGRNNSTGANNSFFGISAGTVTTSGNSNTFLARLCTFFEDSKWRFFSQFCVTLEVLKPSRCSPATWERIKTPDQVYIW